MISLIDAVTAYPTSIYTALLAVVLFYWMLAIVGIVDFEAGLDIDVDVDIDPGLHADADGADISQLASYLVALGLNGVPFSIVVSLLVLLAWIFSSIAGMWILPLMPTQILSWVAGSVVLLLSPVLALPITARVIRPLRKLFVSHTAISNHALVGQTCRVLTGSVDEKFGRAEVVLRGTNANIRVWAEIPNSLSRGSVARILEYNAGTERYLIVPEAADDNL